MSSNLYFVFGCWKIRHNEPLNPEERTLAFIKAGAGVDRSHHSVFVDFRGGPCFEFALADTEVVGKPTYLPANLSHRNAEIPLAIVELRGRSYYVTHLVTRIEERVTHFIVPPRGPEEMRDCLLNDLISAFESNHLELNNFECFYNKGLTDIELEQKYNITQPYDYHAVNMAWFSALSDGEYAGLRPQLGDELQHWSYDNDFCDILPNADKVLGYVSAMHWSRKRKVGYDEPVVTFKKKMYAEDALARWERNYHNVRVNSTPEEALAEYFNLPLRRLPSWRRTRYDLACECIESGNIFMVNFEDSRVTDDRSARGRLQQCEIEYLKTRGTPQDERIYSDLEYVSNIVEQFMHDLGLSFERTNYSKLTFLREYANIPNLD